MLKCMVWVVSCSARTAVPNNIPVFCSRFAFVCQTFHTHSHATCAATTRESQTPLAAAGRALAAG